MAGAGDLFEDDDGDSEKEEGLQRDASSPREHEKASRRQEREAREADSFWRSVLGSEVGRREMWRLIAGSGGAHAFEARFPSSEAGVPYPEAAFYERGVQDFGLRIYHAWLLRDPAAVALMHAENDARFVKPKGK